jgi:GNAT superfamily N-acetyltransferase
VRYRAGTAPDADRIAALHADSWRSTYAFALNPDFIAETLETNRSQVWAERMAVPPSNQHVILAEDGPDLVGFACLFGNDDPEYGTLLDNLHVRRTLQKGGIGRSLVAESASWCLDNYPGAGLYLWVLEGNTQARGFFAHLGGVDAGPGTWSPPGGGSAPSRRIAWTDTQLRAMAGVAGRSAAEQDE